MKVLKFLATKKVQKFRIILLIEKSESSTAQNL